MDKSDPPASLGVFNPVGHTVMAFRSAAALEAAAAALQAAGFLPAALVRYTPAEMQAQVDDELPNASPLAAFGQQLNLAHAHRALAVSGCSFLVVHAPTSEEADKAAEIANASQAVVAQHYGRFIIEEVVEPATGRNQVFESPESGSDLDVR